MKKTTRIFSAFLAAATVAAVSTPHLCGAAPREPAAKQTSADAELENRVRSALSASLGRPAQEIGVSARDGHIMLYGAVRSGVARDGAALAAEKVLGVRNIVNALTIVR